MDEDLPALVKYLQCMRQCIGILWLDQEAIRPVGDDLACRASRCPDRGQTETHPFEIDNAEALITGWDDKDVCLFELFDESFFIERTVKKYGRRKIVVSDKLLYVLCILWFGSP